MGLVLARILLGPIPGFTLDIGMDEMFVLEYERGKLDVLICGFVAIWFVMDVVPNVLRFGVDLGRSLFWFNCDKFWLGICGVGWAKLAFGCGDDLVALSCELESDWSCVDVAGGDGELEVNCFFM